MIDLINNWAQGWAEYFGLVLVQNTLFLGFILLMLNLLKNASARMKYTIGLIGLAKLLLPPMLPAPFLAPQTIISQPTGTGSPVYLETVTATGLTASPTTAATTPLSLLGLFLLIWTGIAIMTVFVPFLSTLRLRWSLRHARPVKADHLESFIPYRRFQILISNKINMPLTLGVFPRQIFVPALWDQWTDPCRKMILRHEMAHIHRHDGLVQIFQILIQAVYFFHPLVWILNRKVNELREMACDDESIGIRKSSSVEYSRYLVEIAEKLVHDQLGCSSASALIRQKNELLKRVLYQTQEGTMRTLSKKKTGVVIAVLLLLSVSLSWTRGRPKPPPNETPSNQEEVVKNQDKKGLNQFLPLPKGGLEAIQKNVVYPEAARKAGLEGRVVLTFTVDKNGPIGKVGIKETTFKDDMGCHEAAIRAVQKTEWIKSALSERDEMGAWFEIPIEFKLGDKDTQNIKGTVINKETGKPVSDVFINIPNTDFKVRSDKNGTFELLFIPVGEHAIQAEFDGYKTLYLSPVILKLNKDLQLNIKLAPTTITAEIIEQDALPKPKKGILIGPSKSKTGKVKGTIIDINSGEPLPGAEVIIDGTNLGAAADMKGEYYLIQVPPGVYSMTASMMGYASAKMKDVKVSIQNTTKVEYKLKPVVIRLDDSEKNVPPPPPLKPGKKIEEPQFVPFSQIPQPVGGLDAIQRKLIIPTGKKNWAIGFATYRLFIDESGKPTQPEVIESFGVNAYDKAAIKALQSVQWKPAMQRDRAIATWIEVPVKFGKADDQRTVIELYFKNDDTFFIDGKKVSMKKLKSVLKKKTEGTDYIFINIKAEDDVLMTTILNAQKILSDMGHHHVNYAINNETGVPYMLPPKGSEEQIKKIPEKNIVSLKINMLGEVLYQDEGIKIQDIDGRLKKDLLEHGSVPIISLEPHPKTRYKDFAGILDKVKQAGAERLLIHLAPPPPPPPK